MTREWMLFIGSLVMLLVGAILSWFNKDLLFSNNDGDGRVIFLSAGIALMIFGSILSTATFVVLAQTLPSGKVEVSK
jgi:hypothetical protein